VGYFDLDRLTINLSYRLNYPGYLNLFSFSDNPGHFDGYRLRLAGADHQSYNDYT
jgi:hypothetical protein